MKRGLYRISGTDGRPNDVRVDDDGIQFPVEEGLYRSRGYDPVVEALPWAEEYFSPGTPNSGAAAEATAKVARERAREQFVASQRKP